MALDQSDNQRPQSGLFQWLSSSLTAKLMVAMAVVAVAPLLATGIFINRSTANELRNRTGEATRQAASRTMDQVTQTLADHVRVLEALVTAPDVRRMLEQANQSYPAGEAERKYRLGEMDSQWVGMPIGTPLIQKTIAEDPAVNPVASQLHNFRRRFPRHVEVFLTDRYGANVAATNQTSDCVQSDEDWWQAAYNNGKGAVYVSTPGLDMSANANVLKLALPVRSERGEVIGVLRSNLEAQELAEIVAAARFGRSGRVSIVDSEGRMVFDSTKQPELDEKLPRMLLAEGFLNKGEAGWLQARGWGDEPQLVGYARPTSDYGYGDLSKLPWTGVATVNSLEALAAVGNATRYQVILGVAAALIAILIAFLTTRRIMAQLDQIHDLFDQLRGGDYMARAPVVSNDELGEMTHNLNKVLDETLMLIQSREERDSIQQAVMKLLDEVSGAAMGDLTAEAEVTADATGAIADAFNYMIAELRDIVSRVQDVTRAVTSTADQTKETTESLAAESETQARQILGARQAIEEMAQSIQQVSENAVQSATVAQQSLDNARQGAAAVQNTIRGMNSIREQVQETAKRIKRLGESSQEIGEVVQLINDIAYRTGVLALNASIQAAMAGDAGRGFAVVAEEVQRLAKRSTEATKRIAALVKAIQTGANEAIAAMEDSTREVVVGSNLANQAGHALHEIEEVSRQLAELNQSISLAAKQQARGSQVVSHSMVQISEFTQQTARGIKHSAVTVNDLAALANQLRASVASFKLPEGHGSEQASLN